MEYCVNCKHLQQATMMCLSPNRPIDLVTGKLKQWSAEHSRLIGYGCSEQGKWFLFIEPENLDDLDSIPFGR